MDSKAQIYWLFQKEMPHWSSFHPSLHHKTSSRAGTRPCFSQVRVEQIQLFFLYRSCKRNLETEGPLPRTRSERHQAKFPAGHHLLRFGNVSLENTGRSGRKTSFPLFKNTSLMLQNLEWAAQEMPFLPFPTPWRTTHTACCELEKLALEHSLYQKDLLLLFRERNWIYSFLKQAQNYTKKGLSVALL